MKKIKFLIVIITIITALILLNALGIFNFIKNVLSRGFAPIQNVVYDSGLKIKSLFASPPLNELKQENARLKEKLKDYLIDKTELILLKQENEFLKKELNFLKDTGLHYQIAKVIAKESLTTKKILLLNQGQNSNITVGCPVIISGKEKTQGYLVGKIIESTAHTSKLNLLTDSKSLVAAKILGAKKTGGIVKGERGLTLKMELIPPEEKVKKGDVIITSGLEEKIPEGLIIGEVEAEISLPGELFGQAKIKSLVDFDNLKIVTILLP